MLELSHFAEPELQFGSDRHVDIRFGLMHYNPFDVGQERAPRQIEVGIVGSAASMEGVRRWFTKCRHEIAAKDSRQPNLFPRFPGFNTETAFFSELICDSNSDRQITSNELDSVTKTAVVDEQKIMAARIITEHVRAILDKRPPKVIVVAVPQEFLEAFQPADSEAGVDDETPEPESRGESLLDFHDLLKSRCMALPRACPIQLVLPATYDPTKRRRGKSSVKVVRPLQDEATRAWNFHTALYYKAGGIPWKLVEESGKLQTCFVGVGFFRTLDKERINTSIAQIFNERGAGVVVRGEAAIFDKEDRQPHLDGEGAYNLMTRAIERYRSEHRTIPARIVVHKTSSHHAAELDGFQKAVAEARIDSADYVSMTKSFVRLFRNGVYPPLRGTFLSVDGHLHVLYTRGSVEFYATYPGMYMPRTLQISCDKVEQTPRYIGREVLGLTKMNWNDTQFDGGSPITVRAASEVGAIMKYAGPGDAIPPHYSFFM